MNSPTNSPEERPDNDCPECGRRNTHGDLCDMCTDRINAEREEQGDDD